MPKNKAPHVSEIVATAALQEKDPVAPKTEVAKPPTLLQRVIEALKGKGLSVQTDQISISPGTMDRHMVSVTLPGEGTPKSRLVEKANNIIETVNRLVDAVMRLLGISAPTTAVA